MTNLNRTPIELWLLTHPDLRRTARVRAFMEMLARGLRRERALLEGTAAALGSRRSGIMGSRPQPGS